MDVYREGNPSFLGKGDNSGDLDNDSNVDIEDDNISDRASLDEEEQLDLMTCKTIENTAKSPVRKKQAVDISPIGHDDDENFENGDETEIDGKVVVELDLAENAEAESRPSNTYAAKKTVAQGMMDIALLTANANQLRYAMELRNTLVVGLIVFSLVFQVSIGIAMIFKGRMYLRGRSKDPVTSRLDTFIVSGIFLITVVNIFIASFTTTSGDTHKT